MILLTLYVLLWLSCNDLLALPKTNLFYSTNIYNHYQPKKKENSKSIWDTVNPIPDVKATVFMKIEFDLLIKLAREDVALQNKPRKLFNIHILLFLISKTLFRPLYLGRKEEGLDYWGCTVVS